VTKEKKVGLFVLLGVAISVVAVGLIGENRKFWERKVLYTTRYGDVAGLAAGSPVRMGGINIGTIDRVYYASSVDDTHVYVDLSIVRAHASRIRRSVPDPGDATGTHPKCKGTVAKVVNKGLLGDKMIELTVADHDARRGCPGEVQPSGERIDSEDPVDLSTYVARIDAMSNKAESVLKNLDEGTRGLADPKLADDFKGSVASLREILDSVAHKDSAAHRLLYDPREAQRVDTILANLESASANLSATVADARDVTAQVKRGPGLAHAVLYDGDFAANATGTLAEVHKDLEQVRTGNGLVHSLLYGDAEQQRVMGNVNAMSDDLRVIVANLRAGKGTLGALLVDPSIYEDVKGIVGNVERNQVLRALVRYSIKQDEQAPGVKVDPAKPGAQGSR
jgi:phospholipid/cholesterol/gamma-HCH transport system substrate-binding protein